MKEIILASLSILASIALVILLILFGWYIVWRLILSRFRFFRELVRGAANSAINELRSSRRKVKKTRKD